MVSELLTSCVVLPLIIAWGTPNVLPGTAVEYQRVYSYIDAGVGVFTLDYPPNTLRGSGLI